MINLLDTAANNALIRSPYRHNAIART